MCIIHVHVHVRSSYRVTKKLLPLLSPFFPLSLPLSFPPSLIQSLLPSLPPSFPPYNPLPPLFRFSLLKKNSVYKSLWYTLKNCSAKMWLDLRKLRIPSKLTFFYMYVWVTSLLSMTIYNQWATVPCNTAIINSHMWILRKDLLKYAYLLYNKKLFKTWIFVELVTKTHTSFMILSQAGWAPWQFSGP